MSDSIHPAVRVAWSRALTCDDTPTLNLDRNPSVPHPDGREGEEREYVIVSIKDRGKGISTEIFPNLFSKFTTSDSSSGTGLGLYICKSIVEAHGGKIWAENNSDGKGAIFKFILPIHR